MTDGPTRIAFTLAAPLPLLNRMLRTNHWERSRQRRALAWEVASKIPWFHRPAQPFTKATITVTRYSLGDPDPDALQCKHLLDVLQPFHPKRHPEGIGIIKGDNRKCLTLFKKAEIVSHESQQCTHVLIEGMP